jgi:hypothetical protein
MCSIKNEREPPVPNQNEDMGNYEELLRQYYARFFPYREFHQWLSYGDSSDGMLGANCLACRCVVARQPFVTMVTHLLGSGIPASLAARNVAQQTSAYCI